ncbi:exopolysaccharide biosynthesis protein [Pseudofulvimonas gallinarii]|jgi:hypothetical protein|uniref:Exopolysaccharide synthesis protein ExoD n=1 Tax=Pseudofulvimonas gallinarii TaxID=634155 RepID=A0A4S3L0A9_9GAMM|nr:exopolysaccharide biosynthesis protein [Pseudofulvimonas gallinarii]TCT01311.1 hypothetical protein EDC25_101173 [Pseudofulvimonas gallinarii]THD15070.1 hypothetical protein B1808_01345 [Pseudofulvimonas gallinarii]
MTAVDRLTGVLEEFVEKARLERVMLGDMLAAIGDGGYGFICLLISLPFLIPVSLGPISTAAGAAFLILGWQMIRGRQSPWLPQRIAALTLGPRQVELMLGACRRVLRWCRKISRPRLESWVEGRRGLAFAGWLIVLGGILIAVPLPGLPLTNTIPALSIIFACVALLERDGLMLLFALFWLIVTLVYFAVIGWILYFVGMQAFEWLKDYLPSWLL